MASVSRDDVRALLLDITSRVRAEARWVRARIFFDLGRAGAWSLYLDSGRAAVRATPPGSPHLTVRTNPSTLTDILSARRPGFECFLAGELEVRGNLSLALQLESLFEPPRELEPAWPRVRHLKVRRTRWSMLEAGPPEAPAVVLLHGLGATKATFLPTVADLSRDHRVIAVDLPGFGDSSKPVASYDAAWFAERVVELLDGLGLERATLIGNSMGGRIAVEVGLSHPDRCRSLVLLAPALAFLRFRQFAPVARLLPPGLGFIPVRPSRSMVMRLLRGIFADPSCLPRHWFEAAGDEFFRVWAKPRGRRAFAASARHIYLDEPHGEAGFWMRLAKLSPPSHFVFGRADPLIPVSFARHVAEALPEARISILDDCGHVPQLEEPEAVHRFVRSLVD